MDILHNLPHTWTRDLREPTFTFEAKGHEYGFYSMSVVAWIEVLGLMFLQAVYMALLSVLVYRFVYQKQGGNALAYFLCYFVVIPSFFLAPVLGFLELGIDNQMMRFCVVAVHPLTAMLKASAAANGFVPKNAARSMSSFTLWYITPFPTEYDEKLDKPVPATPMDIVGMLGGFGQFLVIYGFFETSLRVFPEYLRLTPKATGNLPDDSDWYSMARLLDPVNVVLPNWCYGFSILFLVGCMGFGLGITQTILTGVKMKPLIDNPFMTSRSLGDLWSSKYNTAISECLKIGVYLPVRAVSSRGAGVMATFLVSGLMHEVIMYLMTTPLDDRDGCWSDFDANKHKVECYVPRPFVSTAFFLWQGVVIAIEKAFLQNFKVPLPAWMIAPFIVYTGAPLLHWFFEPYWNSLVLESGMPLFFMVKPMEN